MEEGKWKCHRSDGRTGEHEGGLCVCGAGGMRVARGRQRGIHTFSSSPPFPLATQVETTVSPPVVVSSMEEPGELPFISFDANPTSEPAPNSLNATDDNATTADGSENATTAAASASSAVGSVGTPVQSVRGRPKSNKSCGKCDSCTGKLYKKKWKKKVPPGKCEVAGFTGDGSSPVSTAAIKGTYYHEAASMGSIVTRSSLKRKRKTTVLGYGDANTGDQGGWA